MNFKLNFDFPPLAQKIDHQSKILLLGSCFSDEIGHQLTSNKFKCLSNPYGTIYNPISLFDGIDVALGNRKSRFLNRDGLYFSWDAHSSVYGKTELELQETLNQTSERIPHESSSCRSGQSGSTRRSP